MTAFRVPAGAVRMIWRWYDAAARVVLARQELTACAKLGCNNCCSFPVQVFEPEVQAVKEAFDALPEAARAEVRDAVVEWARVMARRELTGPFPPPKRRAALNYVDRYVVGFELRCPLLDGDGKCRIYESRPLACRSTWKMGEKPCQVDDTKNEPAGHEDVRVAAAHRLFGLRLKLPVHLLGNLVAQWSGGGESGHCIEYRTQTGTQVRALEKRVRASLMGRSGR